jgi:basic amino acid/polyamine antiporter, APA family
VDERPPASASLARRLGFADAVVVGLGAMLGAGVFSVFAPAARAAGAGLLIGLGIAAVIAYCNAVASAQLAAQFPTSGGTYVYGRALLGPWWGFAAGWGFVVGKIASSAAMALIFATYACPGPWWAQRLVAFAAVLGLAGLNYRGVTKTVWLTRILVTITVAVLAVVVSVVWLGGHANASQLNNWNRASAHGVLQAAGLMFFAFAGYARLATLGEEVRDPERTIPRAIPTALVIVLVVYLAVAVSALVVVEPSVLARSAAPLATAVSNAGFRSVQPIVRVGAAAASLGALLSLLAGIGRTTLAMARNRDLPSWLSVVHPRFKTPHHAETALAVVVGGLVLSVDVRSAIGFSSFAVLTYYAVANISAFTQPGQYRRWPRGFNVIGLAGCGTLIVSLPVWSIAVGTAVIALGLFGRWIRTARIAAGTDRDYGVGG